MSEQERERKGVTDAETDPDVEGHKKGVASDEAEPAEGDLGARRESDEPDVEAHKKQA